MQNLLKILFIFIFGILMFSCASSEIKVSELTNLPKEIDLKDLPTEEQYPDCDGVVLYENIIYDIDYVPRVGIETYKTYHKIYRVFQNEEFFMENHIYLNDKTVFESFSARTIKPDGSTHDLTERDIYYYTVHKKNQDYTGKNQSATYNIPQVKKGDLIEIKYTVINSYFYLADKYWVQSSLPKKYSRFEIRLPNFIFDPPSPFTFKYIVKNITMPEPAYKKGFGDSSDRIYVWERKDIPKLKKEAGMGKKSLYQGHINFRLSSWNSWRTFGRKHYERFYQPVLEKMSPEEKKIISDKNRELLQDKKNDLEKIKALYSFVQKLHYDDTHVYFGHGYKPNNIKTIIDRGYGDCKDHTVLLTALLRDAEFEAWPTAIRTGSNEDVDPKFVTDIFDHIIVKIYLKDGQTIWLDPTATYTPFGKLPVQCEDSYSLEIRPKDKDDRKKVRLEKTPSSNYSDNLVKQTINAEIKQDIAIFNVETALHGFFAASSRNEINSTSERIIKRNIRKNICNFFYDSEISDLVITNQHELEKPLLISYKIIKNISDRNDVFLIPNGLMPIPSNTNSMYYKDRIRPIKLDYNYSFRKNFNIKYGENVFFTGLNSEQLNKKFNFNDGFLWEIKGETSPGNISFSSEYVQKAREVKPENIQKYLKTLSDIIEHQTEIFADSYLKKSESKTKEESVEEKEPGNDTEIEKEDSETEKESEEVLEKEEKTEEKTYEEKKEKEGKEETAE